jgi:cob(I)alamin adenosyltransferase
MKGLVHIYTGNGKGKTTAAVGLGVRACGSGLRVLMVQFLKGTPSGEIKSIQKLEPGFRVYRGKDTKKFTWQMNEEEKAQAFSEQQKILEYAYDAVQRGEVDLLIFDEALGAMSSGFLNKEAIIDFIKNKPEHLEIVLTGRGAPEELIELADYVSEIKNVKHPAEKGIKARKGIEF